MTIEHARARVSAAVWQAMAQSGLDLSTIGNEQQAALADAITGNVLLAVDELLGELGSPTPLPAPAIPPAPATSESPTEELTEERTLWSGRPFLSITTYYEVTTERIVVRRGLLNIQQENFDLIRIQDVDFSQNLAERSVNIGDIVIRGADASDPNLLMANVHSPQEVHDIIRQAVLEARKRHRVYTRDVI